MKKNKADVSMKTDNSIDPGAKAQTEQAAEVEMEQRPLNLEPTQSIVLQQSATKPELLKKILILRKKSRNWRQRTQN